ncbi:MAG TPA: hypothetical protein VGV09_10440 [Steroidobacteraceae bacterium]|nr:hypothetical protein [Steroidobacteraceae bacterium]
MDRPDFQLTADWIIARAFVFRAEPRGEVLSRDLGFLSDGTIGGYDNPNERRWSLADGQLQICSESGFVTCSFSFAGRDGGRVSLSGHFCDPRSPEKPSGVMHFLDEVGPDPRLRVQTFDLFDTLVARRCIYPTDVFRAVERKAGVAGFAELRHRVEMRMFGTRPYGIDDIYEALGQEKGWTPQVLARLKMLELAEEWDNYFPIRALTAKVRPEDMIISDMYLPYEFVRRILSIKCGLSANTLHLSNYGKHDAIIWRELAPRYRITRHYGDNLHADVNSPAKFGVPAEHVLISGLSPAEKILFDLGLRPQAEAIREARLGLHDPVPAVMAVQQAQLQLNLPLLLVGSYFLLDRARELEADSLLLCARDCNLWAPLLRVLAAGAPRRPRIHYIAASRAAFYSGSAEYDAYFHSFLGARNILVDVVGTGRSPSHFLERSGLSERVLSLILVGAPQSETQGSFKVETLLQRDFRPFRLALEAMNLSLEGPAQGGRFTDFELSAERALNEFDVEGRKLIAAQQRAFLDTLPVLAAQGERFEVPPRDALAAGAAALVNLLPAGQPALAELSRQIIATLT